MEKRPNVIFIVIDALRAQNLGCYGYDKQTSPTIDKLAREGVLFENAYCCAPYTYPSITSILSGKYPLTHGIIGQEFKAVGPEHGTVFLPEILASKGYTTLAIDWLGGWFKSGFHYYSGLRGVARNRHLYKIYRLLWRFVVRPLHANLSINWANFFYQHKIHAGIINEQVKSLTKKVLDRRFFFFIHYWDTHIPYIPPVSYVNRFIENEYGKDKSIEEVVSRLKPKQKWYVKKRLAFGVETINETVARYDAAISYVDDKIGSLMNFLEDEGVLDETLIIITSDHGESLTEHDIYFTHHGLYEATTHVPLIFYQPSCLPKNLRISSLIQHVDIVPTLLDILGIEYSKLNVDGKSALKLMHNESDKIREAILLEEANIERKRAIRTEKYKYIHALTKEGAVCKECDRIHGGIEELYDLKNDPEENSNIVAEQPEVAQKLRKNLDSWVKQLQHKKTRTIAHEKGTQNYYTKEEEKLIAEKLKELGYF